MTPAQPLEIEREINLERLVAIVRHQLLSAIAHCFVSLTLIAIFYPVAPPLAFVALGLIHMAALYQLSVWWRYRHRPRPRQASARTMRVMMLWATVWGCLWGSYTAALITTASEAGWGPISIGIVGMSSGGMTMLVPLPAAGLAFLLCAMLPPAFAAAASGEEMGIVLASVLLMAGGFIWMSGRRSYLSFLENIRLRMGILHLADEAEAASWAKSRFLANMSHELRTPLNAIIGFAEMIREQMKGPIALPYREFADAINESGRHLVNIINDILDLSKIQSGSGELVERPISVAEVVELATTVIRPLCAVTPRDLTVDLAPNLPDLHADGRRLSQVLINLLSNAVKFSSPGGAIRLEVSVAVAGTAQRVVFRVIDNGVGIPSNELDEVLKPFVQSREAQRRQIPGTGLGLPLADQIMRQHGGWLSLASTLGHGTTVTVTLPAERSIKRAAVTMPAAAGNRE